MITLKKELKSLWPKPDFLSKAEYARAIDQWQTELIKQRKERGWS